MNGDFNLSAFYRNSWIKRCYERGMELEVALNNSSYSKKEKQKLEDFKKGIEWAVSAYLTYYQNDCERLY